MLRNTLFTRLFGLIVLSMLVSHALTFGLLFSLSGKHDFPPPPFSSQPFPPPFPPSVQISTIPPPSQPSQKTDVGSGIELRQALPLRHDPHEGQPIGIFVAFAIELLALASAAWFGAKIIANPIKRLSEAASALGNNVDQPPIAEIGTVEARRAARTFNQMQARLREQIAARQQFLAAVSHDLRTPLTRMRLRVEKIEKSDTSQKLRTDIVEMSAMLDATMEYLRDESHAEAQCMLDVYALASSLVEDYQELGWPIAIEGEAVPILVQASALRRCLMNLMENAVRYGTSAVVVVKDSSQQLSIEIRDQGPGIPADKLEAVTTPFFRLESSRNKATGGVGLGLTIANETIQRQGGTLLLRNAEGGGLIATITLPRQRD